jgi:hypothetical protein
LEKHYCSLHRPYDGEEYSGDDDDTHSNFESSNSTIQEAIKRQQEQDHTSPGVVGALSSPTLATSPAKGSVAASGNDKSAAGMQGAAVPMMMMPEGAGFMAACWSRLPTIRSALSSPAFDPNVMASAASASSSPTPGLKLLHAVRLPRGRHPLRGPFGQMLDAQMSKSDVTRNGKYAGAAAEVAFLHSATNSPTLAGTTTWTLRRGTEVVNQGE